MKSVLGCGFILQVARFYLSATAKPLGCLSAAPAFGEWSSCLEGECGWISGMGSGISMCFDALNGNLCPWRRAGFMPAIAKNFLRGGGHLSTRV